MKHELDNLLRKGAVPPRTDDYWENFPGELTRQLRARENEPVKAIARRQTVFSLGWAASMAVCLAVVFAFGFWKGKHAGVGDLRITEAKAYYKEVEAMFPNRVRAIILDKNGPRLVLAEEANVPNSAPVYIKFCTGKSCQGFITFSGQQIEVNGESYDVLQDGSGHVILAGKKMLWSSKDARDTRTPERIEARPLDINL